MKERPSPYYCRIEKMRGTGNKVRCIMNFKRHAVPVCFPRDVLVFLKLKVGDYFHWYPSKEKKISPFDIRPCKYEKIMSKAEEKELDELIDSLPSYGESLPE